MPNFQIISEGPRTFSLEGELDLATAPLLSAAVSSAVARAGTITIDLSDVTFIDSNGVRAILRALATLPSGCIVLHGVHHGLQRVVDLMRVGQALNLHVIPCTVPVDRPA